MRRFSLPLLFLIRLQVLILVFYTIQRIAFYLWNHPFFFKQNFSEVLFAFLNGIRFDLSATSILMAPCFVLSLLFFPLFEKKKWARAILLFSFLLIQIPFFVGNLIDAELVNFVGRRSTWDALFLAQEVPGKFWTLILSYWPLALISFLCSLIIVFIAERIQKQFQNEISSKNDILDSNWKSNLKKWSSLFGYSFLYLIGLFVLARGGLQNKPIGFAHAQIFAQPMMNNLTLNSTFTLLQSSQRKSLQKEVFFPDQQQMISALSPSGIEVLPVQMNYQVKPNIVLIVMESFSLEYMGKPHADGESYTPFLDQLTEKSLFFNKTFANSRRSIEGIGAIFGGIPALMNEPFISSQYLTNYFLGLGTLLQKEGYQTSFFHGAKNGSMYFDQFMKSAGVENYFGLNEYPHSSDFDGTWGVWDEPFFQWTAEKLDSQKSPFFVGMFSLTSHHPFKIPLKYQNQFPKGKLDIHQSILYADYSLKKFFERIEKSDWFENTIFIITADHTSQSLRPEYQNDLGPYRVPLLIYSPKLPLPKANTNQIVQHTDILPTVLDLVGAQQKQRNYLGRSVWDPRDRYAIQYNDSKYTFVTDGFILRYFRNSQVEFFLESDLEMKTPIEVEPKQRQRLENQLKAAIQYFSQGLWDNKLYYPSK